MPRTAAVFFDVDFTLIYPGPKFQGAGYHESCARHGIDVDPSRFDAAVAGAASVLTSADQLYNAELFIAYSQRIIELMGGTSPQARDVATELYDEWAEHHHFSLYDDVVETLQALHARHIRIGLISNSHRCLETFQAHFELDGLIAAAVSSSELGFMKPHPNIFKAALTLMGVEPHEAAMVGDSLHHDVAGARSVGMRGVLVARGAPPPPHEVHDEILVLRTLRELPERLT